MYASSGGQLPLVDELLMHKADVNAVSLDGWTALNRAAMRGKANVVARLVAAGADTRTRTKDKDAAAWAADHPDVLTVLTDLETTTQARTDAPLR